MPALADIRAALVTNLETQLDPTQIQVQGYLLANPTFPNVQIFPEKVDYDIGVRTDRWTMTVQILVGTTLDVGAQINLDAYLAPSGVKSVKAALESDRTLGGLVDTLEVSRCSGYKLYKIGSIHALGAEWTVELIAGRT